jgi:hypothetical protein
LLKQQLEILIAVFVSFFEQMKVVVAELVLNDLFHFLLAEGFQLYRADLYVM